ncbi:unnamed protein product [Arctia plantaginis]|uniref:Dynein heavy chain n=1 Tax=Arctia plantaginis TaxID=874455 RepID=A0A8S1BBY3_ARCPL|nr:unnamed protein product [Arctia plantaginis]
MFMRAGVNYEDTVFLFTDTQITKEEFLEDINNIAQLCKLHLCFCMSPVGEAFRRRCRMFPSLVNCCTIDWFTKWPPEALHSVALQCLQPLGNQEVIEKISNICVTMHQDVDEEIEFSCGLQKLYETYDVVGVMEAQVREMEPILARKAEEGIALVNRLKVEQKAADEVKQMVMKDEAEAKIKAAEVKEIADEAKADLALAMPAMEAAQEALKSLNKADINELKAFQKPPTLVRFVMEPVCILLGVKPDWDHTKSILKKLKAYLTHKDFNPDTVVKVSKVCRSMVLWVQAIDMYAKVFRVVEPKIIKHKEAAAILKSVMAVLRAKQKEVEEIEEKLAKMLDELRVRIHTQFTRV